MVGRERWFRLLCIATATMFAMTLAQASDRNAIERAAHDAYVAAINSNNTDTLLPT